MGTKQLTAEAKARIYTLYHDTNLSYIDIARITGYSKGQIRHAIRSGTTTITSRSGRPRTLNTQQEEELEQFVCTSKENGRMGYLQLSIVLFGAIFGVWVIKRAL